MATQMKILIVLLIFCVAAGCKNQSLRGRIFERKEVDGNKLLIKYKYQANGKESIDSITINNRKLNSDSINLVSDPANPGKAIPDFAR
jgi:hypothetical protein